MDLREETARWGLLDFLTIYPQTASPFEDLCGMPRQISSMFSRQVMIIMMRIQDTVRSLMPDFKLRRKNREKRKRKKETHLTTGR